MANQISAPGQAEHCVFTSLDDIECSLRYLRHQLCVLEELTALPQLSDENKTVEIPRDALAGVFRNLGWSAEEINGKIADIHRRLHEASKGARP